MTLSEMSREYAPSMKAASGVRLTPPPRASHIALAGSYAANCTAGLRLSRVQLEMPPWKFPVARTWQIGQIRTLLSTDDIVISSTDDSLV